MRADSRQQSWFVEIQALRGFAVLGVVLHHAHGNLLVQPHRLLDGLQAHLDYWTGVDLFFAISGFVIARSLLPVLADSRGWRQTVAAIGSFWIRRAARLWPSAWLWLGIILLASAVFNRSGLFGPVSANAWATLCGVLNLADVRFSQAFMRYDYGASFAWWSLSLEEQFYIVLPLAAILARRALPLVLLVIVAMQFPFVRGIIGMSFRTDSIALGVLLAMVGPTPWRHAGNAAAILPRPAMVALVITLFALLGVLGTPEWTLFRFRIGSVALVSVALVFLAAQDNGFIIGECLLRRGLVWIGTRSYALYLIHVPAMYAVREAWFRLGGADDYVELACAAPIMLVLADMNWRWIEQPFRRTGAWAVDRFLQRICFRGTASYVS